MIALDHGGDIEEADIHGDPGLPLRIACFKGHIDIVRELIRRGADIHAPNAQGKGGPIRMALVESTGLSLRCCWRTAPKCPTHCRRRRG